MDYVGKFDWLPFFFFNIVANLVGSVQMDIRAKFSSEFTHRIAHSAISKLLWKR